MYNDKTKMKFMMVDSSSSHHSSTPTTRVVENKQQQPQIMDQQQYHRQQQQQQQPILNTSFVVKKEQGKKKFCSLLGAWQTWDNTNVKEPTTVTTVVGYDRVKLSLSKNSSSHRRSSMKRSLQIMGQTSLNDTTTMSIMSTSSSTAAALSPSTSLVISEILDNLDTSENSHSSNCSNSSNDDSFFVGGDLSYTIPSGTISSHDGNNSNNSIGRSYNNNLNNVFDESVTEFTFAPDEFQDVYNLGDEIGSGAFATVFDAFHKRTEKPYAVKRIDRDNREDISSIKYEIGIMSELHHPHIVQLIDTFEEPEYLYIVMEKVSGGELLDRLAEKEFYTEKEARSACVILFRTMEFVHRRRIAHRDLKPENIILESRDDDSKLKIADFGLAKKVPLVGGLTSFCGSPSYVAPEVIVGENPYDCQCDVWTLGVITYILLGGYSPFENSDQAQLYDSICDAEYEFHDEYWNTVSNEAKDFIRQLLEPNPRKRLTCEQALQHPWMSTISDEVLASLDLKPTAQQQLLQFNAKRKFRAAIKTLIAVNRISIISS